MIAFAVALGVTSLLAWHAFHSWLDAVGVRNEVNERLSRMEIRFASEVAAVTERIDAISAKLEDVALLVQFRSGGD